MSPRKLCLFKRDFRRDFFAIYKTPSIMFWIHSIETLCTPTCCDNVLGLSMPDATQCASNSDFLRSAREVIRSKTQAVAERAL
jgi:hypothetical protein